MADPAQQDVARGEVGVGEAGVALRDDELVEVTPKSIRLRKSILDPNERKRSQKMKAEVA